MQNLVILIFSRDRAMQLDAVLRSFFLHCRDCESVQVDVLYHAVHAQHANQYEILKVAYPQVNFIAQQDFRRDVLSTIMPYFLGCFSERIYYVLNSLIASAISLERMSIRFLRGLLMRLRTQVLGRLLPVSDGDNHVLFLVDDNLFVRDFFINECVKALQTCHDTLGMSLRLGTNITYCYTVDQFQPQPKLNPIKNGILKFDWTTSELDFGYPLEVSSSIYRLRDIFPVIAIQPFSNPNELEYQLAVSANKFSQQMPYLLCPTQSYTFCNPVNVVQNFASNRAGSNAEYSNENLATLFDQGYRVNVPAYSGFVPEGCHQEVPLEFFRPETGAA